ncbi:MAG TPA: hypothetical protein PLV90_10245, partial [Methanoculleus sp.]|nr:hypothetical protein [Methanoculleus sp.]HOI62535.1 hypothetical protein [Methanoculleus sp.]
MGAVVGVEPLPGRITSTPAISVVQRSIGGAGALMPLLPPSMPGTLWVVTLIACAARVQDTYAV